MIRVIRLGAGDEALAERAINTLKSETPADVIARLGKEYLGKFLSCGHNYFLVALAGDRPAGFALGYRLMRADRDQDMMLLYEIVVDEGNRNQGVGTLLINELKTFCRENKIMKMWVLTNKSNVAATALYKKTGGAEDKSGDELTFTYFPDFE
ncbi:MAG: GNAT family N-acetyltransferase [candidate division WOR-3 bacterium]|nr:MAG: GNAT family N-acetyltransferase [candidate division WOR-3 bacterium]